MKRRHALGLRCGFQVVLGVGLIALASAASAQDPGETEPRLPAQDAAAVPDDLADLEKLSKSLEKSQAKRPNLPPYEFFLSQVAPFDVLPMVKPYHWFTMAVLLESHLGQFTGELSTSAEQGTRPQIPFPESPRAISYGRQALLPPNERVTRTLQMMLPQVPPVPESNQLTLELTRPGSYRPDALFEAPIQKLELHQMVVLFLSADPSEFSKWSRTQATVPTTGDRDLRVIDRSRYYRLVIPLKPDKPFLSPHPLVWTTMSHVVWDGFSPDNLTRGRFSVQQAMLDWLHWGGQLIVLANTPNASLIEESALGPYLPARITGEVQPLSPEDLEQLASTFPPPFWGRLLDEYESPLMLPSDGSIPADPPRYLPRARIEPVDSRPITAAVLEPIAGRDASIIPLSAQNPRPIAVERRIGRGRITMVAIDPTDPTLAAWPGIDTFLRAVVFRRGLETWRAYTGGRFGYGLLSAPQLTWLRYVARDLGTTPPDEAVDPNPNARDPSELLIPAQPVAAWIDKTSELPRLARGTLEKSSGITIPGSGFVLRVVVAYLVALIPLNWLLCRFVLRRKEFAWVITPLLALGFAYGVERTAVVNQFPVNCDEIDILELQRNYPRGHLTRLASLYATGRNEFTLSEAENPTSLILPMRAVESLRHEETRFCRFESVPTPRLTQFLVQPRSIDMFRAEAMVELGGTLRLEGGPGEGELINGLDFELLDAVLIDTATGKQIELGRIGPRPANGALDDPGSHRVSFPLQAEPRDSAAELAEFDWAQVDEIRTRLCEYRWTEPCDQGELRLVAWARDPYPGLEIEPGADRHRGVRLVVAHLQFPPVPPGRGDIPRKAESEDLSP